MVDYYDEKLDRTLAALADPTRRAIVARLSEGNARVTEVAAPFSMSLNAVSKHLKVLENAGLVRREVRGREHWLSFDGAPLVAASDWIDHYRRFWEGRLDALATFLRENKARKQERRGHMTADKVNTVPTVRISRLMPAPREAVFAAWLDAEGMRHWMCPGDVSKTEAEIDPRVGGAFRIVMHGEEKTYVMTGEYVEIDPSSRIVFTWESNVTEGESLVTLEFHDRNGETELVLTHERLADAETAGNYEKGWTSILEKLAERLAA